MKRSLKTFLYNMAKQKRIVSSQCLFARSFCLMFGFLCSVNTVCRVCCTHIISVAMPYIADVMIYYATTICLLLLLLLRLIASS